MREQKTTGYREYQDSGVQWIGHVPAHWRLTRLGNCFKERRAKVSDKDFEPLSVTKMGILPQLAGAAKTNDGDNRKLVCKGDFVINSRSDRKGSSGIAKQDGSVSLINIVLSPKNIHPVFCNYLLKSNGFIEEYYRMGHGIVADLWTTRYDEMRAIILAIPSEHEQAVIGNFLDQKTAKIDAAIALEERQIALLKERKQIVIQNAVTKGLNPNAPMKDSGVAWIGEIPAHWEIKRAKYLFREMNDRSDSGAEELLSVSHMTGVTPRSEKNIYMFMAEDYSGSKLCEPGDLVYNIMWAWMGALGVSDHRGIVSPSYAIFRPSDLNMFNRKYLEWLMRSNSYVEHYNKVSTGLHSSRLRFYSHMFFDMFLGYPSREEQEKIVAYIEDEVRKIDAAIRAKADSARLLAEYKATLINSAVTGKIKVA